MSKHTSTTTQAEAFQVGNVVEVDPGQLLTDRNIRDAKPDRALIASIKRHGVIEPITAVLTTDGELRVRTGHRRTHAAIDADLATVPVYVHAAEGADDDASAAIGRITRQHDENTHRAGLTSADKLGVVEELALFGLSINQMTRHGIKKADAQAAATVSDSPLARAAVHKYDSLSLDQAAVVAEFEDDPDTVKALVVAAHQGQFDHAAQRARSERREAEQRAELVASLNAAGITVVERPAYSDATKGLHRLAPTKTAPAFTSEAHASCPGHVAWIGSDWVKVDDHGIVVQFPDEPDHDSASEDDWTAYEDDCSRIRATSHDEQIAVAEYGCADPTAHGHHDLYAYSPGSEPTIKAADKSPEEREADKQARALVIAHNKAWADATVVRHEWLAGFAKAKNPPKGTAAFLATAFSLDRSHMVVQGGNQLAAQLLGKPHEDYGYADLSPAKSATEQRGYMITLVQVLADYEAGLHKGSWRGDGTDSPVGRYLRFLARAGYTLSEVETFAISENTA